MMEILKSYPAEVCRNEWTNIFPKNSEILIIDTFIRAQLQQDKLKIACLAEYQNKLWGSYIYLSINEITENALNRDVLLLNKLKDDTLTVLARNYMFSDVTLLYLEKEHLKILMDNEDKLTNNSFKVIKD